MEKNLKPTGELYEHLAKGLLKFHKKLPTNGIVYLEDSVLWYCIDYNLSWYLSLNINERINFKGSY